MKIGRKLEENQVAQERKWLMDFSRATLILLFSLLPNPIHRVYSTHSSIN
jgi:hypothetical protein